MLWAPVLTPHSQKRIGQRGNVTFELVIVAPADFHGLFCPLRYWWKPAESLDKNSREYTCSYRACPQKRVSLPAALSLL